MENGYWLLKRKFKDGKLEWRLKRTENSDSETVEYFLYDPTGIPGFNVKDYCIKFYWIVTRFLVNSDVWIDSCSWFSGKQRHVYNVITCKGSDAYNQIKPFLNNNPFIIPSKPVVCLRYFFPELLSKILPMKERQAITNYLQIFDPTKAVPLDDVNAYGFWTKEELLDYVKG